MKLALMGLPGSGKTSLGQRLASHYSLPWMDVDDHLLEPAWGCSVASQLSSLGDSAFLAAEDSVLVSSPLPGQGVISCTGSNPLGDEGMERLVQEGWLLIWLDVDTSDVLKRLQQMKVERIVGQSSSSLKAVLEGRLSHYSRWHHLRILVGRGWDLDTIQDSLVTAVDRHMKEGAGQLATTRSDGHHRLDTALLGGLAPCGGLYLPSTGLPHLRVEQLERLLGCSYTQVASVVLELLVHPQDIRPQQIHNMVTQAYSSFENSDVVPLVHLEQDIYLAELFHGPSGSFKDLALQLTPQLVARALASAGGKSLVLVATSGDTGGAVLEGFGKFGGSELAVLVLFPTQGVSLVQKQQMISFSAPNVKVVAVEGNFDDCQRLVKGMFREEKLAEQLRESYGVSLNTANSINWGRLLPQVAYHFHCYLQLVLQGKLQLGDKVDLAVPSGNLGNMVSALLAREMGLPYGNMIVAANSNNVLSDFFTTGCYDLRSRGLVRTISPAIDILVASNLERWLCLKLGADTVKRLYTDLNTQKMFQLSEEEKAVACPAFIQAGWCTEDSCKEEIGSSLASTGYLLDPHTAVAVSVAKRFRTQAPLLVLATAHYSKFWDSLECLVTGGRDAVPRPSAHLGVASCLDKPEIHTSVINPTSEELLQLIGQFAAEVFPRLD